MDEEAFGLVFDFAVLPQMLANALALFTGIGEYQAFASSCVLENVSHSRVGIFRCGIAWWFQFQCLNRGVLAFTGLRPAVEEVLHRQSPHLPTAVELGDDGAATAACREELSRRLGVAEGGRQSDPSRPAARQPAEPFDQAEGLQSAVAAQQRVNLVDDDEAQVAEQGGDLHVLVDEQRFQRLGGDLEDARRFPQQLPFPGLRCVAVPPRDADAGLLAQLVQPSELVVDEGLQRRDVKHPDGPRRFLVEQRQDGEEGGLGLAGGGGGGDQDVVVGAEDGLSGGVLHAPQRLPSGTVDVVLDEGGVSGEDVHGGDCLIPYCFVN